MGDETGWQEVFKKLCSEVPVGLDDMTELVDVTDHSIAENLKLRLMQERIYTCIGRVLIAVNPFRRLEIYDKRYIKAYNEGATIKGKQSKNSRALTRRDTLKCSTAKLSDVTRSDEESIKELPPHIYALTDNMYESMMIEKESQCVIISGESGAGKTVSAKYIMSYLSEVASGGTEKIEEIKNIIIQSNPLLEAFGNAKTLRNNNSSRFGKFVEILFNMAGQPDGGKISNFLLEKSRVVSQNPGERNYHVFYQLLRGCTEEQKEKFGLFDTDPEKYYYLNRTGGVYDVPDADDHEEFLLTMNAMDVIGMSEELQINVLEIISAILHLGNIQFKEENNVAEVEDPQTLVIPSKLLGVDSEALKEKLVSRLMEARWGGKVDIMMMTLNTEQAMVSRDALAKALYAQMFDLLVTLINRAMKKDKIELCIGVLDIYGFEIFETNGFEQFCINYVNEKLQQIFVELTLKNEQEEYLEEGITWTPVKFFNNKLVCDLIESKNPPGIMSVLDDVCFTVHASEGSDRTLMEKLKAVVGSENTYSKYFRGLSTHFEVHHYAGKVHYETKHFCERNKDVLFEDVIHLMQSSRNEFIKGLFNDMPTSSGRRGRSSTGSSKIKTQCQDLIDRIMASTPHYVRCLKPSETKEPLEWHDHRILPQISYLGLRENIEVRRAGFVFRRVFDKMIERYSIILDKDISEQVSGDQRNTCEAIMKTAKLSSETWRIGLTKVFMKESDMITKLEQARSDALFEYAVKLQSVIRGFLARRYCKKLRERIRATLIIQRTLRNYVGRKRLNYRLLIKQRLKDVMAELESEASAFEQLQNQPEPPESQELPEYLDHPESQESPESQDQPAAIELPAPPDLPECSEAPESSRLTFTHNETTDHVGYHFNKDLQGVTGNCNIFFTCQAKLFSKNLKMEKHLLILSLCDFHMIQENTQRKTKKYVSTYKLSYAEIKSMSVSILDTEFLVLQMESFDLILESPHKNSLIAFFMAVASTMKEKRPQLGRTDLFTGSDESGKDVCLKFLKEGRKQYKEPRVSKSGKEITVTIPDPDIIEDLEEVSDSVEGTDHHEPDVDEDTQSVRKSFPCRQEKQDVEQNETSFSLSVELGKSGGKVSCKGFFICVTESSSPRQTVDLTIYYQPPTSSCLESGEILVSPFVIVANMTEDETELRFTLPFLSDLPKDIDTMAKWIRFYSAISENSTPEWRDIRTLEDLSAFMVEIHPDHARLITQQNVVFCIVGSRELTEEEVELYGNGKGLDYSAYGDCDYGYDYGYGEYGCDEYGQEYGDEYGEDSGDKGEDMQGKNKFEAAGQVVEKALETPMPGAVLGLPPPVPSSKPPPRPFPSPFENIPLNEENERGKKKEKKSKKKEKKVKKEKHDKKEKREK